MPSLTVTEKNHWKERIARRIEKRVEMLLAAEPNLMDRSHREALLAGGSLVALQGKAEEMFDTLLQLLVGYVSPPEVFDPGMP